jgi:hypothetical protein
MILLRADASAKNIMREEIMGRHYLFWLRPEGLRHVISWIGISFAENRNHEITRTKKQITLTGMHLSSLEDWLTLFKERRNPFILVLGGKAQGKKIDLAFQAFIEI